MPAAVKSVDRSFAALCRPIRRAIRDRLRDGDLTSGEIAAPWVMKKPTISRHLKVLENAGLIVHSVHGRRHRCRLRVTGWSSSLECSEKAVQTDRRPYA